MKSRGLQWSKGEGEGVREKSPRGQERSKQETGVREARAAFQFHMIPVILIVDFIALGSYDLCRIMLPGPMNLRLTSTSFLLSSQCFCLFFCWKL